MKIFTAGYEGTTIDAFFYTLLLYGVQKIIDVREIPISRKKGFSKNAFKLEAEKRHIEYFHLKQLGCPKEIRHAYREHRDWQRYLQDFIPYLKTQKEELIHLLEVAKQDTICLVCFEADANFCHRLCVVEAVNELSNYRFEIIHLDPVSTIDIAWQMLLADKSHQQSTIDLGIYTYFP